MKYKENQRFRRADVLLLVIVLISGTIYRFIDRFVLHPSGARESDLYLFILILLGLLVVMILLLSLRLITRIDSKGIRFQLYPWHYQTHKIKWEEIEECQVVKLPLRTKLSGWNVNIGTPETFLSFNGRTGLALRLTDGRRIFIGSRDPEALAAAIRKYMPKKEG